MYSPKMTVLCLVHEKPSLIVLVNAKQTWEKAVKSKKSHVDFNSNLWTKVNVAPVCLAES